MIYLGIAGCLVWMGALFLPLTYYPAFQQYLSFLNYEYMLGTLVGVLGLLVAGLWATRQPRLVAAVALTAGAVLIKDTMVFFLPKAKIFLSWGFFLLAGAILLELFLALWAMWGLRRSREIPQEKPH